MPPVSLPSGLSFQLFLKAARPPGRGGVGHRADGDFHCRPATTSALTELTAQEPIRKAETKRRITGVGIPQRDTVPCYSPAFPALKSNLFDVTKPGQSLEEQLGCGERE